MKVSNIDELHVLMKATRSDDYREEMTLDEISEVLQKDGSRVRRLKTFQQSQTSKQSWRAKRNNFMAGIKRFHRNGNVDLRKKVSDRLKNWGKVSPFTGDDTSDTQYEYFIIKPALYFDLYEMAADITLLEADVLGIASTFALEEQFVDSAVFADCVVNDLSELRKLLLSESPIPSPLMETLLILVEPDLFEKKNNISGDFSSSYSKLITK